MLRAFGGDPSSPLHRTMASLTTLLDDYRAARQAVPHFDAAPAPRPPHWQHPAPPSVAPTPVHSAPAQKPAPPPTAPSLSVSARAPQQAPSTPTRTLPAKPPSVPPPVIPPPPPLPPRVAPASGQAALRRKAFRPRKVVLPASSVEVAAPAPAAAETDAAIALMLRDTDLQQKLAERVAQHIATDHTATVAAEPQPEDMLEGILASLHDDPDMAHLFGASLSTHCGGAAEIA